MESRFARSLSHFWPLFWSVYPQSSLGESRCFWLFHIFCCFSCSFYPHSSLVESCFFFPRSAHTLKSKNVLGAAPLNPASLRSKPSGAEGSGVEWLRLLNLVFIFHSESQFSFRFAKHEREIPPAPWLCGLDSSVGSPYLYILLLFILFIITSYYYLIFIIYI